MQIKGDAKFSKDRKYRYTLFRTIELPEKVPDMGIVVFIMLNPSKADAEKNHPTIRKCIDFAKDWRYGRLMVVNLFAYKSPELKVLALAHLKGEDIVGCPRNNEEIEEAVQKADLVICAWGSGGSAPASFKKEFLKNRSKKVIELVKGQGKQPYTISMKLTALDQPQHPRSLNFPDDTMPKLWEESRWPRE